MAARTMVLAPLHRLYRRIKIRRLVQAYGSRTVWHRYGACGLSILLEDPLAEGWYDHDWPQLAEVDQLATSRLRAGARVFDLGAHQGVVAMMLAHVVGADGFVVAVEADRHNYDVAIRNQSLNRVSNVEFIHAAVAAEQGYVQFVGELNGHVLQHGALGSSRIPAVTVDGLMDRYGPPDVVFIDVEGYELEALRGATACITTGHTDFFVETHVGDGLEHHEGSAAAVVGQFPEHRFRRLVSPAGGELDDYEFAAFDSSVASLPNGRFFLIALARCDPRDPD